MTDHKKDTKNNYDWDKKNSNGDYICWRASDSRKFSDQNLSNLIDKLGLEMKIIAILDHIKGECKLAKINTVYPLQTSIYGDYPNVKEELLIERFLKRLGYNVTIKSTNQISKFDLLISW